MILGCKLFQRLSNTYLRSFKNIKYCRNVVSHLPFQLPLESVLSSGSLFVPCIQNNMCMRYRDIRVQKDESRFEKQLCDTDDNISH